MRPPKAGSPVERFLNLGILKEPLNWLTVFLMCAFALVLLYLIAPQQTSEG